MGDFGIPYPSLFLHLGLFPYLVFISWFSTEFLQDLILGLPYYGLFSHRALFPYIALFHFPGLFNYPVI